MLAAWMVSGWGENGARAALAGGADSAVLGGFCERTKLVVACSVERVKRGLTWRFVREGAVVVYAD